MKKTTRLKEILNGKELSFLMEAHNGMSAKIVEETGFEGIWASGLCISASMGVRDSNEASWTQVLEVLEFISDATTIPMLLDGDTGYGNFNNMRRLVKKLEQRGVAGVCIEDKLFPKKNSFIQGDRQLLASIEEFTGKIKAGKDTQEDKDFCVVARTEALIAGLGVKEALNRAEKYHEAGADAILVHSKKNHPKEIIEFMNQWDKALPVVIVPTKYYRTPTEVFKQAGVSVIMWANHMLRSSVSAMQKSARQIYEEKTLQNVEENIAPLSEIFRLQCAEELEEAEKIYLPEKKDTVKAVILAASRGKDLGALTEDKPKALINIGGTTILEKTVSLFQDVHINHITIVRGYKREKIMIPDVHYVDNEEYGKTQEVYSLLKGIENLNGTIIATYGDILFKKYLISILIESEADFNIIVDADWKESSKKGRYTNFVSCHEPYKKEMLDQTVRLNRMSNNLKEDEIHGEWVGLLKLSEKGLNILKNLFEKPDSKIDIKKIKMSELFNHLIKEGHTINVSYIKGHWVDVDDLFDISKVITF